MIHAGVYYLPGSLKARLCVEGAREMYEYCERRGVAAERCGKLIVATEASELGRLDELERRGRANGVPGLRRVDAEEIRELEPHARGIAGLHSPATGIADFPGVARAYGEDIAEAGGDDLHRLRGPRRRARCAARCDCATRRARPRPATPSSARAPGRTAWRLPQAPTPTRGSFPSAAPTCGCCRHGGIWFAR